MWIKLVTHKQHKIHNLFSCIFYQCYLLTVSRVLGKSWMQEDRRPFAPRVARTFRGGTASPAGSPTMRQGWATVANRYAHWLCLLQRDQWVLVIIMFPTPSRETLFCCTQCHLFQQRYKRHIIWKGLWSNHDMQFLIWKLFCSTIIITQFFTFI